MDSVRRLIDLWRTAGLVIRPGVHPAMQSFELKYGVQLPADLRDYFLTVDGMEDDLDPGINRFWPLEIVKPVSEELRTLIPTVGHIQIATSLPIISFGALGGLSD